MRLEFFVMTPRLVLAALLMLACARVLQAGELPLSVAEAYQPAAFVSMQISPDGRHIAAVGQAKGGTAVFLIDADSLEPRVLRGLSTETRMALDASWIGNELVAVERYGRTLVFNTKGDLLRSVSGWFIRSVSPDARGHERILTVGRNGPRSIDRIDVRTGDVELMNFDMPGEPLAWVFDKDGVPLVATTISTAFWTDDTTITHWYRASMAEKWRPLESFPWAEVGWFPAYLAPDGRSLVVSSTVGRDTSAFVRYSLADGKLGELLAGHPREDIEYALRDVRTDEYLRVQTSGMTPQVSWFDPRGDALQRAVDAALPGRINRLSAPGAANVLVYSHADVDPGRWYVLDTRAMRLKFVAAARPSVDPARMRPKRIVRYPSLDGLAIPAYVTQPADDVRAAPAVVLIHGGPMARDSWDWDPLVQLLAARGYVVIQPQFRGSAGFGKAFEAAGYRQWGRAMQDDVTAAADWLVRQGIADARRMCVIGASYGGYAAMWALARTPTLFRCGASLAGVSDLTLMFDDGSDLLERPTGRLHLRRVLGDVKAERARLEEVSPLRHAQRIRAPVLLAHGDADRRVPIEHARRLRDALVRTGRADVELLELKDAGHGGFTLEEQERWHRSLFNFLARHIGGTSAEDGGK